MKTTLRKLIEDEFTYTKESFDDIQYHTYKDEDLDLEKINQYGRDSFDPFYAWSVRNVYFLCSYDGMNFVNSVPRYCTSTTQDKYKFTGHASRLMEKQVDEK